MKLSTLLLVIVAAGIWLHIFMPATDSKTSASVGHAVAPPVRLRGRVMEKTPEGLIVNCTRDLGADYANGEVNAFGRFLIKEYPDGSSMTGGEVVTAQGVDAGTCYSSGEFLQTYRYVGAVARPATNGSWGHSLDAPTQQVGGWTRH